ncbi:hypothetical protein TNCT_269131 [Trichonephila clavata]|uniref:Uncharacterized protein n=1 Tax=Trichonephila clavata TaxID=2740835 RepID=A0A8X6JCM4_TRICU|nr:hypothetical protein TNCT_269131 [Trichonephila clavata]
MKSMIAFVALLACVAAVPSGHGSLVIHHKAGHHGYGHGHGYGGHGVWVMVTVWATDWDLLMVMDMDIIKIHILDYKNEKNQMMFSK